MQVWMIAELVRGCVAACGSPGPAADGLGLSSTEDGYNAQGVVGRLCAGAAGYFLFQHRVK